MNNMDEMAGLLKQYNNMCKEYWKIYKKMHEDIKVGQLDKVDNFKVGLRQINKIIVNLQLRLDTYTDIPGYNPMEGYSINKNIAKLDHFVDSYISHSQGMKDADGTNRYENDGISDSRKIPREDARKAALAWGEGYEPLIDFLETCIQNGIQTYGCCSGHKDSDSSYVMFDSDDEQVTDLIEYLIENKLGNEISTWINPETGKTIVAMYISMENRERVYKLCREHIRNRQLETKTKDEEQESTMIKLRRLIKSKGTGVFINYSITDNVYTIVANGVEEYYTPEEMEVKITQVSNRLDERKKVTVIDRIKEICSNSQFGLEHIMQVKSLLTRKRETPEKQQEMEEERE